jgi:hypothetical protein
MGLAFDEQHATAGVLYSSDSTFYCVWFVVVFLMVDGSPFTIQMYLVSDALSFLSSACAHKSGYFYMVTGLVFKDSIRTH